MSDEIVKVTPTDIVQTNQVESFFNQWDKYKRIAGELLKSNFLQVHFKTPEQVVAVMLKGRELNIPPMEALQNLFPVNGRIGMMGQLMLSLVQRSGELEDMKIEKTVDSVTVTIKRKNRSAHSETFGTTDAKRAGLLTRDVYQKYPINMYQWRAIANNLRITFPDFIGGFYLPEELGAEVVLNEEGNMEVSETPYFNETQAYLNCNNALEKVAKERTYESLKNWLNLYKSDLEQLSDKFKDMLRRAYTSICQHLPESERKLYELEQTIQQPQEVKNGITGESSENKS